MKTSLSAQERRCRVENRALRRIHGPKRSKDRVDTLACDEMKKGEVKHETCMGEVKSAQKSVI
jgi:hypothetical protein